MPTENEKRWIAAWKSAGPELERIRNEELRQLDEATGTLAAMKLGVPNGMLIERKSGIIHLAAWFLRQRAESQSTNE